MSNKPFLYWVKYDVETQRSKTIRGKKEEWIAPAGSEELYCDHPFVEYAWVLAYLNPSNDKEAKSRIEVELINGVHQHFNNAFLASGELDYHKVQKWVEEQYDLYNKKNVDGDIKEK